MIRRAFMKGFFAQFKLNVIACIYNQLSKQDSSNYKHTKTAKQHSEQHCNTVFAVCWFSCSTEISSMLDTFYIKGLEWLLLKLLCPRHTHPKTEPHCVWKKLLILCWSIQAAHTVRVVVQREKTELLPQIVTNYFHFCWYFEAAPLLATAKKSARYKHSELTLVWSSYADWGRWPK